MDTHLKQESEKEMASISNTHINFGMVGVAVKIQAATKDHGPGFHLYHEHEDSPASRVDQVYRCKGCEGVFKWSELERGMDWKEVADWVELAVEDHVGDPILVTRDELSDCEIGADKSRGAVLL